MKKYIVESENKIKRIIVCSDVSCISLQEGETLHEAENKRYRKGDSFSPDLKKEATSRKKENKLSDYIAYGLLAAGIAASAVTYYFTHGG